MFGVNYPGAPYPAQAFALRGEVVIVVTEPDVLELIGVSMGPVALVATSMGALSLVAVDDPGRVLKGVD